MTLHCTIHCDSQFIYANLRKEPGYTGPILSHLETRSPKVLADFLTYTRRGIAATGHRMNLYYLGHQTRHSALGDYQHQATCYQAPINCVDTEKALHELSENKTIPVQERRYYIGNTMVYEK